MSRYRSTICSSSAERRGLTIAGIEYVTEQVAEGGRQPHDRRGIAGAGERRDAVETVEQEMRLQVSAERLQAAAASSACSREAATRRSWYRS